MEGRSGNRKVTGTERFSRRPGRKRAWPETGSLQPIFPEVEYRMKAVSLMSCIFLACLASAAGASDENLPEAYPHVTISNGIVETTVFLPDSEKGFYRSTRFDWSGIPWQLTFRGHTYFTRRLPKRPHDPLLNESGMSLAGEFDIGAGGMPVPTRFAEANPGETFMKIGVGNLVKPDDGKPYRFNGDYRLADPGKWTWRHGQSWIEFTHVLRDEYGYGYIFTKRMELPSGRPELVVRHTLKNTGTRAISTLQYCHNFFFLDRDPVGKHYRMDLTFPARFLNDLSPTAEVEHGCLILKEDVVKPLFSVVEGFGDTPGHNRAVIRNTHTGAGVDIGGDFAPAVFNFFAETISFCPELFARIEATPGETRRWTRTYRFFEEEPKRQ